MVGKVEVEGFVDLFPPIRLPLREVVVAPTKEGRVFHSGWAELSVVMMHNRWKDNSLMSITARGDHTHARWKL